MKTTSGKGFYDVIGEPILQILEILADNLFGSFGLAIIAFTLITRLVLLPLTVKQFRSSREMQHKMRDLRPRLDALKKKYKKDPRKLMEEQMKVYKEVGITPLGCLTSPMYLTILLQMPILVAMIAAVRLGADDPARLLAAGIRIDFLWLDLTQQDPYFILPVMVAGTMYLSQRLMMDAGGDDPQTQTMKKVMNIMMPLFFLYICAIYASGLALYWFVSTAVNLGVQYYVKREQVPSSVQSVVVSQKPKDSAGSSGEYVNGDPVLDESRVNKEVPQMTTSNTGGSEVVSATSQVFQREAVRPDQHKADIVVTEATSKQREAVHDGRSRSKRKNRRRGPRYRPGSDGSTKRQGESGGVEEG